MALLGRIVIILFAFLAASLAAAIVLTLALVSPEIGAAAEEAAGNEAIAIVIGMMGLLIAAVAFIPGLIVIVLAEALRIRSVLFYGFAGGAAALISWYLLRVPSLDGELLGGEPFSIDQLFTRENEAVAGAGIAAGLVYWLIAGRKAGERRTAPPPLPAR